MSDTHFHIRLSHLVSTLVLIRHGPSAYVHPAGVIDRVGVEEWRTNYDAAGIRATAQPPADVVDLVARAACVLSSDLRRASESAARLALARPVLASALLRETPLAIPHWPTRLPLGAWGALIFAHWQYRRLRGTALDPLERARVSEATTFVATQIRAGTTGVVVTHGVFRALMASELLRAGWVASGRRGGYGHWSTWSFQRPGAASRGVETPAAAREQSAREGSGHAAP